MGNSARSESCDRRRIHQAWHRDALEPEREARFESRSYGFRPGRSCQGAISVIHVIACGKTAGRLWVLTRTSAPRSTGLITATFSPLSGGA